MSAPAMPLPAQRLAMRMGEYDILHNCTTRDGVAHVLYRIASRLSRPVALAEGIVMLDEHHARIEAAFEEFFPQLQVLAAQWPAPSSTAT